MITLRHRPRAAAAVAALLGVLVLSGVGSALPATAAAKRTSHVTATWSATKVTAGASVVVHGKVNPAGGHGRKVVLQRKAADGSWSKVRSKTSRKAGGYRFRAPTANTGRRTYRVLAPKTHRATRSASRATRLVVRAPAKAGPYKLMYVDGQGRAARWNPCDTITVRVNSLNLLAPTNASTLVTQGLAKLSAASGLKFHVIGSTTFLPFVDAQGAQPADADMVIAWSDQSLLPLLKGNVAGYGGAAYQFTADGPEIVQGDVVLDVASSGLQPGYVAGTSTGAVMLHELGHAVGLDHVNDPTQVMNPAVTYQSRPDYQSGDRAGLAKVGAKAGCL